MRLKLPKIKLKPIKIKKENGRTQYIADLLIFNSVVWVYLSYVLAFMGRTEIAESLSKAVVTEILGVIAAIVFKNTTENLSKNNHWPDKTDKKNQYDEDGNI